VLDDLVRRGVAELTATLSLISFGARSTVAALAVHDPRLGTDEPA
jgi:hypothetical protein